MNSHTTGSASIPCLAESEQVKKLKQISAELLDGKNTYNLSLFEKQDVTVVLNTLEYIVVNAATLSERSTRTVFFISKDENSYAPIHLENYPQGLDGKKQMLTALVDTFIYSFDIAKKMHVFYVKKFCGKLSGICIDARTRGAFDYALTLSKIPAFTDYMKDLSDAKAGYYVRCGREWNYFDCFDHIYLKMWGKPYSKDTGNAGHCKQDGIFDENSFGLISEFLTLLGIYPGSGFLIAKDRSPNHSLVFNKFILFHKSLLDDLGINEKGVIKYSPQESRHELAQEMYDNYVMAMPTYAIKAGEADSIISMRMTLFNRASHRVFFKFYFEYVEKLVKTKYAKEMLNTAINRLEICKVTEPDLAAKIFKPTTSKESMLHWSVELKDVCAVEKLIKMGDDVWIEDDLSYNPICIAAKNKSWDIVSKIAELKSMASKSLDARAKSNYGFALDEALKHNQIVVAYKLMSARAVITDTALVMAFESNDIALYSTAWKLRLGFCSYIVKKDDFQNQCIVNNKINLETWAWILKQPEISIYLRKNSTTEALIRRGDVAQIALFLSNPHLNIGNVNLYLTKIAALPHAAQIQKLFDSMDVKLRIAVDMVELNHDYDGAVAIVSEMYKQNNVTNFDLAEMLGMAKLNPLQQDLIASQFLQKNSDLMRQRMDIPLFKKIESYLQSESKKYITPELKAAFAESKPVSSPSSVGSSSSTPALTFFARPGGEKRSVHPELAKEDDVKEQATKKIKK